MAGYQTGHAELIKAVQDMNNVNDQLQGNLKRVEGAAESVASAWQGSAASAFQQLIERYKQDAQQLQQKLNHISENVAGSAAAYQRQEEEAKSSFSNRLNG
ncbi:MAG: WXG100 family type VII secretion target [Sciscionella sp.]